MSGVPGRLVRIPRIIGRHVSGRLSALVGEWEGEGGLDTASSHSRHEVLGTPYLEKVTFKPFGPVDNGSQALYGLDEPLAHTDHNTVHRGR